MVYKRSYCIEILTGAAACDRRSRRAAKEERQITRRAVPQPYCGAAIEKRHSAAVGEQSCVLFLLRLFYWGAAVVAEAAIWALLYALEKYDTIGTVGGTCLFFTFRNFSFYLIFLILENVCSVQVLINVLKLKQKTCNTTNFKCPAAVSSPEKDSCSKV